MKRNVILFFVLSFMLLGCNTLELAKTIAINLTEQEKNLAHYKIGKPYRINGKWYYPRKQPFYDQVGMASWYGDKFHKRLTANGEIFDKNLISAAHRTLPMPSIVKVTNLENGRELFLKVNDRGPFAKDRIIDLSEAAAIELGVYEPGTARVRVQFEREKTAALFYNDDIRGYRVAKKSVPVTPQAKVVEPEEKIVAKASETNDSNKHFVQIGAYSVRINAARQASVLKDFGEVHIEESKFPDITLYKVRLGPFDNLENADKTIDLLRESGITDAIITKG